MITGSCDDDGESPTPHPTCLKRSKGEGGKKMRWFGSGRGLPERRGGDLPRRKRGAVLTVNEAV